ncbi:MAG TPA: glycosyltransferase family 39 protein, partial [Methyloceanibacter sp.]|nr:glycosyltransferase family 39 protein [Methyloceanibacter sp.]
MDPTIVKAAMLNLGSRAVVIESSYARQLALCLGGLLVLRLAGLYFAETDLGFDEAQYWSWSRALDFGYFSKPPMIAWLIRGASAICGDGEACIRAASPVLYTLASLMLYLAGRSLYGERIGFWSAIVFATLPGVSFSSNLITTDVPLILFWTIMLYAWVMLVKRRSTGYAVLLGMAIGLGLLAKQAMIYAVLCIACHAAVSHDAREALKGGRSVVAAAVALALFSPNLIWNAEHGFPTARHTAANIGWQFPYVHPLQLGEFVGAQLGVFGPILFVVLLRGAWRVLRVPSDGNKLLLLSLSLPVLVLLAVQAMLSRAHGNWAATAYPAASIFVTMTMLELNRLMLFRISLALHLLVAVVLAAAPAFARQLPIFEQLKFMSAVVGWREASEAVRAKLDAERYGSILVDS